MKQFVNKITLQLVLTGSPGSYQEITISNFQKSQIITEIESRGKICNKMKKLIMNQSEKTEATLAIKTDPQSCLAIRSQIYYKQKIPQHENKFNNYKSLEKEPQ